MRQPTGSTGGDVQISRVPARSSDIACLRYTLLGIFTDGDVPVVLYFHAVAGILEFDATGFAVADDHRAPKYCIESLQVDIFPPPPTLCGYPSSADVWVSIMDV